MGYTGPLKLEAGMGPGYPNPGVPGQTETLRMTEADTERKQITSVWDNSRCQDTF